MQCFTVSSQSNTIKYVKTTEKSFEFPVINNKIVQGESLEEIFDKKKIDQLDMPIEMNEKVNMGKMELDSGENRASNTLEENDYKLLETLVKRENNLISFLKDSNYDRMERHQFLQEIIDERQKLCKKFESKIKGEAEN